MATKDTTFFSTRESLVGVSGRESIIRALENIRGYDEKKLTKELFKGVTSKETLKTAIINFLKTIDKVLPGQLLSPENTTGIVSTIVDEIWNAYELVKSTVGSFWDWICDAGSNAFDWIQGVFSKKIGSPRQLAMRKCIDEVYASGLGFRLNNMGDYEIFDPKTGESKKEYSLALVNINGQQGESDDVAKQLGKDRKNTPYSSLKEEFSGLITERSATAQGVANFTEMFLFSGINIAEEDQIDKLDRTTLSNVYLNYAQRDKKPEERFLLDREPRINGEVLKNLIMPPEQKDFVQFQLDKKAEVLFDKKDLDFFKKAATEHKKITSITAASVTDLAQDVGTKALGQLEKFSKNPGEILKHASGLELAALLAFAVSSLVFNATGYRKELWMGLGGVVVLNMLVKGYNGDPEKGLASMLGLAAKKGQEKLKRQIPHIDQVQNMLGTNEKGMEALYEIAELPLDTLLNITESVEMKNGLVINENSEGKQSLKFTNFDKIVDKDKKKEIEKQFGEGKAEEKILEMLEATFKQVGKRIGAIDGNGVVDKKKVLEFLQKTYPAGRKFNLGQMISYELIIRPGLGETKVDQILMKGSEEEIKKETSPKGESQVSKKIKGKDAISHPLEGDEANNLIAGYAGTLKLDGTIINANVLKAILLGKNTNSQKLAEIKKLTSENKGDIAIKDKIIERLSK